MAYTFDPIFAVDPNNPANVAKSATITIFDPADIAQAPITIKDPTGSPLPNPITVDAAGMGPAYQHPTLARVGWKGAGFTGYFTSYEGMLSETVAARTAAQAAANAATTAGSEAASVASSALAGAVADAQAASAAATNAAALVGAPADSAIASAVNGNGATKAALNTTYRPGVVLPKPSGGDDGAVLAAAITSAATKGLPLLAPYLGAVYLTSQTLLLPSNFEFLGDLITVKARPNLNAPVFKNSDQANGNSFIRVSGVTADYDRANQTGQANVWDIENITHSRFENIGAKNGKHVGPNLGIGVGFSLRKAVYCTVRALYAEGNQWDGMQMSGCTYNEVSDVIAVNNGRAGIQLTRWPVGSGTLRSAYNRITGLTTRHDTGAPSALAPCTSGLYFHMSEFNVCTNINSYGTQQGVGMIENSNGNVITTGIHHVRFDGTRGIIDIEGGCHSNVISDHLLRGETPGNNGIFVRFSGVENTLNVVKGLRVTQSLWTGQSRVIISSSDTDNTVEVDTANGVGGVDYQVAGTRNHVKFRSFGGDIIRRGPGNVDSPVSVPVQPTTPATPTTGVTLFTLASGTLGVLDNTGKVTEIGYGIIKMPPAASLPTADASRRGQIRAIQNGAGVADALYLCRKKADDTYEWYAL